MIKCDENCTPCCDFCIYAIHEAWEEDGKVYEGEPLMCRLHKDDEHKKLAQNCSYCNDYHCNFVNKQPDIYRIFVFTNPNKEMLNNEGKPMGWPDVGRMDDVGFYYEKETAIKALHENWCNIQDHCFNAAFLVQHEPGLYPMSSKERRIYFIWDKEKQGFFEQPEPEIFKNFAY